MNDKIFFKNSPFHIRNIYCYLCFTGGFISCFSSPYFIRFLTIIIYIRHTFFKFFSFTSFSGIHLSEKTNSSSTAKPLKNIFVQFSPHNSSRTRFSISPFFFFFLLQFFIPGFIKFILNFLFSFSSAFCPIFIPESLKKKVGIQKKKFFHSIFIPGFINKIPFFPQLPAMSGKRSTRARITKKARMIASMRKVGSLEHQTMRMNEEIQVEEYPHPQPLDYDPTSLISPEGEDSSDCIFVSAMEEAASPSAHHQAETHFHPEVSVEVPQIPEFLRRQLSLLDVNDMDFQLENQGLISFLPLLNSYSFKFYT